MRNNNPLQISLFGLAEKAACGADVPRWNSNPSVFVAPIVSNRQKTTTNVWLFFMVNICLKPQIPEETHKVCVPGWRRNIIMPF